MSLHPQPLCPRRVDCHLLTFMYLLSCLTVCGYRPEKLGVIYEKVVGSALIAFSSWLQPEWFPRSLNYWDSYFNSISFQAVSVYGVKTCRHAGVSRSGSCWKYPANAFHHRNLFNLASAALILSYKINFHMFSRLCFRHAHSKITKFVASDLSVFVFRSGLLSSAVSLFSRRHYVDGSTCVSLS